MDFTANEFGKRLGRLQQLLTEKQVDLAILNQSPDLYYFTGSAQPLYLVAPAAGQPVILARKAVARIHEEVAGIPCEYFQNTRDMARIIAAYGCNRAQRVGFSLENTAYGTVNRWLQLLAGSSPIDLSQELRFLRMVKSQAEQAIITAAGKIMAGIPGLAREAFRPGLTELELSVAIENYLRLQGHGGIIRNRREAVELGCGVCSGGTNALAGGKFDSVCVGSGLAPANPFGASNRPIARNQPVIMDYAINYRGYHVDQTRMFCWGSPDTLVVRAFQAMLEVERVLMEELRPGKTWSELYARGLQIAADYHYEAEFMGVGPEQVRFVGHGVGLELDEPPYLAPKLGLPISAGMTIALEPKVALPGIGVIGNEDTVLVREDGCECLTVAPPEMIIV
ncbi:MAG: Xaa-Pro peptidase family protein [Bacillota bacterium]|jgi:Xaa-Pro aminopeptidase